MTATPLFPLQAFSTALFDISVSNVDITLDDKIYRIMFDFMRKVNETRNQQALPISLSADDLLEFSEPIEVLIILQTFPS